MIVVDTSAVVSVLVGRPAIERLRSRLAEGDLHAPHLIDVEFLSTLRRLVRLGELSEDRAGDARSDFEQLTIRRYSHQSLTDRSWELRHNLTVYDAVFVALAETLNVPLVTVDRRAGRAPGHGAVVEVYGE